MKAIFLITLFILEISAHAQIRTTGGGTVVTKTKTTIDIIIAENFTPRLLTDEDSSEKKLEVLRDYLAHIEYRCGLRRKIQKNHTILDSYYNLAFGTKVPTSAEMGRSDLCQHSDKVKSCLKHKARKLREIMEIVNKDKKIPLLLQKQLKIDHETVRILLEFFTRQGQLDSK